MGKSNQTINHERQTKKPPQPKQDKSQSRSDNGGGRGHLLRVEAQNDNQKKLLQALYSNDLTFAEGPAGTGKTYLAISAALNAWYGSRVERIILARPAVEVGESIGLLPGDLMEKMAPFMAPLYEALAEQLGGRRFLEKYLQDGTIEIMTIGHMRGRTFKNAYVIVDEAQNCTPAELKMILTRIGEGSKMVLTGDPMQSDLPPVRLDGTNKKSTLSSFSEVAKEVTSAACGASDVTIGTVRLEASDIVRHPVLKYVLKAFEQ